MYGQNSLVQDYDITTVTYVCYVTEQFSVQKFRTVSTFVSDMIYDLS